MDKDKESKIRYQGQRSALIREHTFSMLSDYEVSVIQEMKHAFRQKKLDDLTALVAKLVAIDDLKANINSQINRAERLDK